jgi:hypothetical protein
MIGLDDVAICTEFLNAKDTFTYGPHFEQGLHEIATTFRLIEKSLVESKVSGYHLIFDLNGVLVVIGEGPTRFRLMILRPRLKEFFYSCATKFTVYIWSFAIRRNFSKHLEIIKEGIGVHLESSKIVDHELCFKNEHFLFEKPKKTILHKNLNAFFGVFRGMNYENTLLVDDMLYKS